jgi:hypothetical protein
MSDLSDLENSTKKQNITEVVHEILGHFGNLVKLWSSILPANVFYDVLGFLIHHVLSKWIVFVESIPDISEHETHILHQLLSKWDIVLTWMKSTFAMDIEIDVRKLTLYNISNL